MTQSKLSYLIVLIAGAIQALSFAPGPLPGWTLPFVQVATLAILANYVFAANNSRQAFTFGWLFGVSLFCVGIYWLTISMHVYGGMALGLAIGALFIFASVLALYIALACTVSNYLCGTYKSPLQKWRGQLLNAVIFASSWTIFEWLRGTLFTGFTWLSSGYAHVEGMFTAWAPIFGAYGLGWLAAFSAAAIALMARAKDTDHDKYAAVVIGIAIVFGLLGIAFKHIAWSEATGQPLLARLVQTNTPQENKFAADTFFQYQQAALKLANTDAKTDFPQLIIMPETVIPALLDQVPEGLWQQWQDLADSRQAQLILGVPLRRTNAGQTKITNSAISIGPKHNIAEANYWHYDKQHLVPFGEFIPAGFRWFVNAMQIPLGDFDRGQPAQTPLKYLGQNFAINICYEDTFGSELAASVAPKGTYPGANIIVNISNLAWFGNTWALRQHLWMARLRAIETARPMLRATNTGITAVIDPSGLVRGMLEPARPGILDAEIIGAKGLSPYVKFGDWPILIISMLGLLLAYSRRR